MDNCRYCGLQMGTYIITKHEKTCDKNPNALKDITPKPVGRTQICDKCEEERSVCGFFTHQKFCKGIKVPILKCGRCGTVLKIDIEHISFK